MNEHDRALDKLRLQVQNAAEAKQPVPHAVVLALIEFLRGHGEDIADLDREIRDLENDMPPDLEDRIHELDGRVNDLEGM